MSGRRTKQLREECTKRLGSVPRKATGHVTMRAIAVETGGRGILRRLMAFIKPENRGDLRLDEFRFFKRHGMTRRECDVKEYLLHTAQRRHWARGEAA